MSVPFSFTLPASSVPADTPTTDPLLGNSKARSQKYISESIDNIYRTLGLFFKGAELKKLVTMKDGKTYYDLYQEYVAVVPSAALRQQTQTLYGTMALNFGLKARAKTINVNNGEYLITIEYTADGSVTAKSIQVETKTGFAIFKSTL